jgi:hypothetical protein
MRLGTSSFNHPFYLEGINPPPAYPGHVRPPPPYTANQAPPPYSGRDDAPPAPPPYRQISSGGLPRMSQSLISFLEQHESQRGGARTGESRRPGE